MVHPLSCCGIWRDGDPGAARGAVPPSTAPDERMLVRVPVRGGAPDPVIGLMTPAVCLDPAKAQKKPNPNPEFAPKSRAAACQRRKIMPRSLSHPLYQTSSAHP